MPVTSASIFQILGLSSCPVLVPDCARVCVWVVFQFLFLVPCFPWWGVLLVNHFPVYIWVPVLGLALLVPCKIMVVVMVPFPFPVVTSAYLWCGAGVCSKFDLPNYCYSVSSGVFLAWPGSGGWWSVHVEVYIPWFWLVLVIVLLGGKVPVQAFICDFNGLLVVFGMPPCPPSFLDIFGIVWWSHCVPVYLFMAYPLPSWCVRMHRGSPPIRRLCGANLHSFHGDLSVVAWFFC